MTRNPIPLRPLAERSVMDHLQRWVDTRPDEPAFVLCADGEQITWGEAAELAGRFAGLLGARGLGPGDHVGLLLPNGSPWVVSYLGSLLGAYVDVAVDPDARGAILHHYLTIADVKAVVCLPDHVRHVMAVWSDCPLLEQVLVWGEPPADVPDRVRSVDLASAAPATPVERDPRLPRSIRFTSGTSGPAKAAQLSESHLDSWAAHFNHLMGYEVGDRLYTPFPLSHHLASVMGVLATLYSGGCCIIDRRFSRSRFWRTATEHGATLAHMLEPIIGYLMSAAPGPYDRAHSVRRCYIGGPHAGFEERFGTTLQPAYALTEGNVLAYLEAGDPGPRRAPDVALGGMVVGRANPHFEIAVLDDNDEPCATGERGVICFRSRTPFLCMSGYLNDDGAVVRATANQWFHTGDVGVLDSEGYLHFFGRSGDNIRRNGVNIAVSHIEQVARSFAGVVDAAVVATERTVGDGEVVLFVEVDEALDDALDLPALAGHLRAELPAEMVPRYVRTSTGLPRTRTHKIVRTELRAWAGAEPTGPALDLRPGRAR